MRKIHAQADLSGWLSPDEERLISLYRDFAREERDDLLYRMTRRRVAHMFVEHFDVARDAADPTYCFEELEQWLREILPVQFLCDYYREEPHASTLITTAWGGAARVVLGSSERDGQHADELFNAAVRLWDMIGWSPTHREPMRLTRKDALTFLEEWRNAALAHAFRHHTEGER